MKKAEITAFLSMVFVLFVSFVLGMLEVSVIQTSKSVSRLTTDRAVFSVFGEYNRNLFDEYHVFALDGSYGTGVFTDDKVISRLHCYGSPETGHEITGRQYLTDDCGQAFREQVLEYMETKYGISVVRDFTGLAQEWEEQSIRGEEMAEKEKDILSDVADLREQISQPEQTGHPAGTDGTAPAEIPEGNPFACLEQIEKSGVLSLVMPEEMELSGLRIRPEEQASNRSLAVGNGTFPKRQGIGGADERLLFNEYVLKNFSDASSDADAEVGEKVSRTEGVPGRTLSYEIEYILEGNASDKENLEAVVLKLFFIRMGLNYLYLMGDSGKQAEAAALAVAVTTVLLIPETAEVLKQLILLAWAAGESVVDLRTLLSGKRTALVKNSENWQLPLASLLTLGSGGEQLCGEDTPGGVSYKDYLRILLFLKDTDEITMRTLDRVEENLSAAGGQKLRADQCITKIEVKNTKELFGGLTYTYPAYFGYE